MRNVADSTESLLTRTKRLLAERPTELSLREIAEGAGVGHQWVRSLVYGAIKEPGVTKLEKVYGFMLDYHAARRFRDKRSEPRAS